MVNEIISPTDGKFTGDCRGGEVCLSVACRHRRFTPSFLFVIASRFDAQIPERGAPDAVKDYSNKTSFEIMILDLVRGVAGVKYRDHPATALDSDLNRGFLVPRQLLPRKKVVRFCFAMEFLYKFIGPLASVRISTDDNSIVSAITQMEQQSRRGAFKNSAVYAITQIED
jgi:hypothetical protein